jgi:hypothetical protein
MRTGGMLPVLQAHIAKRQQAIPKAAIDDLMLVEDDEVAARVLAWRKSRGFDQRPGAPPVFTAQRPADLMLRPVPVAGSGHGTDLAVVSSGALQLCRAPVGSRCSSNSSSSSSGRGIGGVSCSTPQGSRAPPAKAMAQRHTWSASSSAAAATAASHAVGASSVSGQTSAAVALSRSSCGTAASTGRRGVAVRSAPGSGGGVDRRVRQRRRWTQIGNVFCDELTGWVHVCDETCRWVSSRAGSSTDATTSKHLLCACKQTTRPRHGYHS